MIPDETARRARILRQQVFFCALFVLFWAGISVPQGAVHSAWLAWQRGRTICLVPRCWKPIAEVLTFHREDKPAFGFSDEVRVGLCAMHASHPPADLNMDHVAAGQTLCVGGIVCILAYVISFVGMFPRQTPPPPSPRAAAEIHVSFQPPEPAPPAAQRQSPVFTWFLITVASVIAMDVAFWYLARY